MGTSARRKIMILTDGKAGHENQSKALARALGCDFELVKVTFRSRPAKALSYALDHIGIRTDLLFRLETASYGRQTPLPDPFIPIAVIGTGSGTFYAAKTLARKTRVRCGVVLYPRGYDLASFDCILAPSFDRPKKAPNVIEIPANLVAADTAFYDRGVADFRAHYARTTGRELAETPDVSAVIVGGPNPCSTMPVDWMKRELDRIFAAPASARWVTTSRRTPAAIETLVNSYPWDYRLIYSQDRFNPIPAFVRLARRLYVTAESTGMLSEACTCGTAKVIALDNLKPGHHKFRRFVEGLRAEGYVDGARKVDLSQAIAHARRLIGIV